MSRNTKRVRRSPAQWRRLVAEQAESVLAPVAFCRARGLSPSLFCHWKRKLVVRAADEDTAAAGDFVELIADITAVDTGGCDCTYSPDTVDRRHRWTVGPFESIPAATLPRKLNNRIHAVRRSH